MAQGMSYQGLCLSRDMLKIDSKNGQKSEKIRKIYNCRCMPNCVTDMDVNNYIYDNIYDYLKKSVKTAFFMCLVSLKQSCLVNEPKRDSIFCEKGLFRSLIYFLMVNTALRTSQQVQQDHHHQHHCSHMTFLEHIKRFWSPRNK